MLAIGKYYARRNKTAEDYNLGGRRMSPFAVGLSLFATLTSSVSYLAVPGEFVKNGPMIQAGLVAYPLIAVAVGWGLIPFIMRQQVTSAYAMLEQPFGVSVRLLGSTIFLTARLVWMATVVYATSYAVLSPLLGLGPRATIVAAIALCTITIIYTAEGGLRAVVVTDATQSLIMLAGAVFAIAVVSLDLGGVSAWWPHEWQAQWAEPKFELDSSTRITFLGAAISTFAYWIAICGSDQMAIQRWLSTRDASSARRSLFTMLGTDALVQSLLGIVGLAVVGYFTAHPELFPGSANLVEGADKLFPLFLVSGLPMGLAGLIVAAVLAAAMSSLSSGMNSSCVVITDDFIGRFRSSPLPDAARVRLSRFISVGIGVVVILLSLLVSQIQGNLIDLCFRVVNLLVAPLFVLFFLAMFVRWATAFGAWVAALVSIATAVFISFSESFGAGPLSITWIIPGSFFAGAVAGGLASLLPIGGRAADHDSRPN